MKTRNYRLKQVSQLIAITCVAAMHVQAALYPDMPVSGPTSVDLSWMDPFDPPVDANMAVSPDAPQIAEWARQNNPGDTMVLTGEALSSFTNSVVGFNGYPVAFKSDGVDDYVDTGIVPSADLSFEVDGIWPTGGGWYQQGHGSQWAGKSKFFLGGSSEGFGFKFADTEVLSSFENNGFRNTLYIDRTKYGVNGEYVSWTPSGTFSSPNTIKLFHFSVDYPTPFFKMTVFRATIKNINTGKVLFNAIVREDGTFYDTVSESILVNSGRGLLSEVRYGSQVPNVSGEEGRDTQFIFYGQNNTFTAQVDGLIQRLDGRQAAITLPTSLPENQFYLMWPRNSEGYGKPVAINKPQGWYALPQYLTKGENFSVYGRSLIADKDSPISYVYVEETGEWLTTSNANPYKADYTVPTGYTNGTYTLWPHNGTGGKYGWGEPLTIVVDSVLDFSGGKVRNVKSYGAIGNGIANDSPAIAAAFSASSAKDTIYFPAGTYAISSSLPSCNNRRILGAGMDSTTITTHSTFSGTYGDAAFINWVNQSVIENITLDVGDYKTFSDVLIWSQADRGNDRLRCEGVRFTMESTTIGSHDGSLLELSHINNCTFRNCEIITGKNIFCGGSTNMLFEGCDFYGMLDVGLLVLNWGGENISMTDCTAQNLDNSDARSYRGFCQGRVFHGTGLVGACRNQYFGGCTTANLTPRLPVPWVSGVPSSVTANTFVLTPAEASRVEDSLLNKYAQITGGTGSSRFVKYLISGIDKSTGVVTLEKDWVATTGGSLPDTTSTIQIYDPIPNRNTGEQFMFEFTDTNFRDYADSATSNTVVFSSLTNNYDGEVMTIIAGRGLGQSRVVAGDSSRGVVRISRPWNVTPDTTSLVMIGAYLYRVAIVDNYLDGTTMAVEDDPNVAVEGVSTFGGSIEICAEGNTFHEMRHGISTWGLTCEDSDYYPDDYLYNPNYFNYFVDNLFDGCRNGVRNRTEVWDTKHPVHDDLALLGSVYRGNTMTNLYGTAFKSDTTKSNTWAMTVFDQNVVYDCASLQDDDSDIYGASSMPTDAKNQIWVGNAFTNRGTTIGLIIRAPNFPVFQGNAWSGFFHKYAGDLPGPVLEIPRRIVEVSGGTYEFEIFNSGTSGLNWSASVSPSNSWIIVLNPTGSIPSGGKTTVSINVDTSIISPYDKGIITISDGHQAKQVTVVYDPVTESRVLGKSGTKFPLFGFEGETLRVELYIGDAEIPQIFGPWEDPNEINLDGLSYYPWRKMIISTYDSVSGIWNPVWTNWTGQSR